MKLPSHRFRLVDILVEIETISTGVNGVNLDSCIQNRPLRRMVERCVEIISEACRHLPVEITDRYPDIPWKNVRAIGNILRHEYGRVDDRILWQLATISLPRLQQAIQEILNSMPPDPQEAG